MGGLDEGVPWVTPQKGEPMGCFCPTRAAHLGHVPSRGFSWAGSIKASRLMWAPGPQASMKLLFLLGGREAPGGHGSLKQGGA